MSVHMCAAKYFLTIFQNMRSCQKNNLEIPFQPLQNQKNRYWPTTETTQNSRLLLCMWSLSKDAMLFMFTEGHSRQSVSGKTHDGKQTARLKMSDMLHFWSCFAECRLRSHLPNRKGTLENHIQAKWTSSCAWIPRTWSVSGNSAAVTLLT